MERGGGCWGRGRVEGRVGRKLFLEGERVGDGMGAGVENGMAWIGR